MRLAGAFEQLIVGWKAQGWALGSTRALFETLQPMALPRCTVGPGEVPGRAGTLLAAGTRVPRRRRPRRGGVAGLPDRRLPRARPPAVAPTPSPPRPRVHLIPSRSLHMPTQRVADFTLPATGGRQLHAVRPRRQPRRAVLLSEGQHARLHHRGRGSSATCTHEFAKAGAVVVGISRDSLKSHENFKAKMELPVPAAVRRRRGRLWAVRRHQDEEHVRQAGARHRAQHLRRRRRRHARARVARRSRCPATPRKSCGS